VLAKPDDDDVLAVAESLVDELAILHAAYWGQPLDWLGRHAVTSGGKTEAQKRMAGGAALVRSAVDQFANDLPTEFQRMAELYV
jgi:hypothetical protein